MAHHHCPNNKHDPKRAERDAECCRLREEGKSLQEIAKIVGYSGVSGVSQAIKRSLNTLRRGAAKSLVEQQSEDLDGLRRRLLPLLDCQEPDLKAAIVLLKTWERQSKLLGLDRPAKSDVTLTVEQQANETAINEQIQATLRDPVSRLLSCMLAERLDLAAAPLPRESIEASLRALALAYVDYPMAPSAPGLPSASEKMTVVDALPAPPVASAEIGESVPEPEPEARQQTPASEPAGQQPIL